MARPEPPAALWGDGGRSEPQPIAHPQALSHMHAHAHSHTHTLPHTSTQVLIYTHTIILAIPRQQESVSARPERKIKAAGKPAPDVPGAYSWASPWLRGPGRPARLGLRKGDYVSTLAQSPASSCPPSGSLEHMLRGASWECQDSPRHPAPS